MRNHYHSTDWLRKPYQGAEGCAEGTTRSPGLPALTMLHYDQRDALLMEQDSHSPLPAQLLTVFLSLIEQDVLHHTKEVFSVMCLRCANYKQDLLPCFIPCCKDKHRMAPECHLTRPAANMFATWERRAGEPGVWLLLIPQVYCFSFAILTRTSIALPWTKGLVVDSVMPCDAFIPWFGVEHHGCDIL